MLFFRLFGVMAVLIGLVDLFLVVVGPPAMMWLAINIPFVIWTTLTCFTCKIADRSKDE